MKIKQRTLEIISYSLLALYVVGGTAINAGYLAISFPVMYMTAVAIVVLMIYLILSYVDGYLTTSQLYARRNWIKNLVQWITDKRTFALPEKND